MPARAIEVSFCGAATTASTSPASAALIAVPAKASDARPPAASLAPKSSAAKSGCGRDHAQVGLDAAGLGVAFDHAAITDHDRIAGLAHRRIERGLEADLRSDAGRVARRDGDDRFVASHGELYADGAVDSDTLSPCGRGWRARRSEAKAREPGEGVLSRFARRRPSPALATHRRQV